MKSVIALLFTALASACSAEVATTTDDAPARSAGVVLQYHHVDTETPRITSTSPDEFRSHMAYLKSQDFVIWPLPRLVETVRRGEPTPPRVAAITFDDAYDSIYSTAFPILQEYGWPFTIFVATEPVIQDKPGYLNWAELKAMEDAGATIANHTHTHLHLLRRQSDDESDAEWLKRIGDDITTAQALLKENLDDAPKLFAYPYGEYDPAVIDLIERLGFVGFGQQSGAIGPDLRFSILPRFPFGGVYNNLEPFKTKVMTLPMPIETVIVNPMIDDDLTPSITLTFTQQDLRLHQLVCYTPGGGTAELERDGLAVKVINDKPVPVGRSRYNCTMPATDGRFYWFSQLWIRKRDDGTWYPEP